MKITLYGPAVDNSRRYRDAGSDVEVGDAADQIAASRAQPYLDEGRAIEAEPVDADAEPGE